MAGSSRYLIAADSEVKSIAVTARVGSPARSEGDGLQRGNISALRTRQDGGGEAELDRRSTRTV